MKKIFSKSYSKRILAGFEDPDYNWHDDLDKANNDPNRFNARKDNKNIPAKNDTENTDAKNTAKAKLVHYVDSIDQSLHILEISAENQAKDGERELIEDITSSLGRLVYCFEKINKYLTPLITPEKQDIKFATTAIATIQIPLFDRYKTFTQKLKNANPKLHKFVQQYLQKVHGLFENVGK